MGKCLRLSVQSRNPERDAARGDDGVGQLEVMRRDVAGEIAARLPPDGSIQDHLTTRLQKPLRDVLLPRRMPA